MAICPIDETCGVCHAGHLSLDLRIVAAAVFVGVTPGTIPVAAGLIAVRIAVLRRGVFLDDLGTDITQHFASDLLILLEISAFASSPISHYSLPVDRRNALREECHL